MSKADFLMTKSSLPSFIRGLGMTFGNAPLHCAEEHFYHDDEAALAADWNAIGLDMREALDAYKKFEVSHKG